MRTSTHHWLVAPMSVVGLVALSLGYAALASGTSPDTTMDIGVKVVSQNRCPDGDSGSKRTSDDLLVWGSYADQRIGAHLQSWDAGSITRGLWLTGNPSGDTAVLTGSSGGMLPMTHTFTVALSAGQFVSGAMESTSTSSGCTTYREITKK